MLIPLILTSFTHLWNLSEFPLYHADEGHYMRRIFVVLNGIGLLEKTGFYTDAYDHPYFGQLFVGSLMRLSGYPNFAMEQTTSSIELVMAFPRMIMGIFAIMNTFLVFKITQRIYNFRIAFFASILFAVSPMTWIIRMTTLDTIALPFLLASILTSLSLVSWNKTRDSHKHIFLVLLSGTLLGLAILTKIPLFTMIPLVGYLIYKNSNHLKCRLPIKTLVISLIPIFLIPSFWPLYAIYSDQFDSWKNGVLYQLDRERKDIIQSFFEIDWLLLFLGLGGLVYSFLRRDWILIFWITPFIIFVYLHGWFLFFHWIIVFPVFCIAGAKFVIELAQKLESRQIKQPMFLIGICIVISGIGFFNTFAIINQSLESAAIMGISKSLDYLDKADGRDDDRVDEKVTVIAPSEYSWIFKYVYKLDNTFDSHRDLGLRKIVTNKTLILQHDLFANRIEDIKKKFSTFVLDMNIHRKICFVDIEWYKSDFATRSPLTIIPFESDDEANKKVFEVNKGNEAKNHERLDINNLSARYINITLSRDAHDRVGAISEIGVYGKINENDNCKKIPINTIKFKDHSLFFNNLDNYDIIASYQKILTDINDISRYPAEKTYVNRLTEFFSPFDYYAKTLQLKANF